MKIECLAKGKGEGPIEVSIGNEVYSFEDDGDGRKVCEVWIERHIESFLAREDMYREVKDEPKPATDEQADDVRDMLSAPAPRRGRRREIAATA